MKKTYISGFDDQIVSELREFLDVTLWINDIGAYTHNIHDLTSVCFPKNYKKSNEIDYACYQSVYQCLGEFIDIHSRSYPYYNLTYHDYLNVFNRIFYYGYDLLKSNKIEQLIFSNIPHEGFDFLILKIAQYLKLSTLMFHQTPFPNKFWALRDVNDFGLFSKIPDLSAREAFVLKTSFDWFYMNEKQYAYGTRQALKDIRKSPLSFPYVFYKYKKSYDFQRSLRNCVATDINMSCRYVYFPLHLQPELTTSALGGVYADQMLALERLSQILPNDWVIYVKENPKQTERQRDKGFFDRLKDLGNAVLVPMQTNSMELIKGAQFVATITGTAGWEAISIGKKVLVFGRPWYFRMPGVYAFDALINVDDIVDSPAINATELAQQVSSLLCKAAVGVVDPAYQVLVKDFDARRNSQSVANTIKLLMK